jgi:hypothetical protein
LRETFGDDMSEVFRRQTLDAWREGGWRILLRVLYCAIAELFTVNLPARAGSALGSGPDSDISQSLQLLVNK